MNFIVATIDGSRVLCQFADMAPVIWIDARVAEAIGYSYALHFETRRGADRCAFIHNGAAVALGDWDHDTEANREVSSRGVGRCTCGNAGRGTGVSRGDAPDASRRGPARAVSGELGPRRAGAASRGSGRAQRVVARLAPVVASDWRERGRLSRVEADAEYTQLGGFQK